LKSTSLIIETRDGVATITLNRPSKLNALNEEMLREISVAIGDMGDDQQVKAIIITGAGRAFCSGADLSEENFSAPDKTRWFETLQKANRIITGIRNIPKPVIAAINGIAAGGGCNLALACDIIIASEKATFSEIYITRGLHPDLGGIYFLPRLVGIAKASDLFLTGRTIDAAEADRIGLISRVVPEEQLEKTSHDIALVLAQGPTLAIQMIKASINQSLLMDLNTVLESEARAQSMIATTKDFQEGLKAFFDKRKPVFSKK
jgi:2-(1,2-epoxy-1,2-dihydrophenyl)acetyl-CoA isomerase